MKRKTHGRTRPKRTNPSLSPDPDLKPNPVSAADTDGRVEGSQALSQAHELLETVTKGMQVSIAAIDTNYCYRFFNSAYADEIWRLSGKKIQVGASILEFFSDKPERQGIARELWTEALRGESTNRTIEFDDGNRYHRFFNVLCTPLRDPNGKITGAGQVAYDIIEQKRAEETMRLSEANLRGILNATQESIWLFSPEGSVLAANETALRRFGLPPEEIIGKNLSEILPADLARARQDRLNEVAGSNQPLEFEDERAGMLLHHNFYPVRDEKGRVISIACFSRDITEHKRMEETLRESEDRYRLLVETMKEGLVILNQDSAIIYVNDAFCRMVGYPRAELLGQVAFELLDPNHRELVKAEMAKRRRGESRRFETVLLRTGGEKLPVLLSGNPIIDHNGNFRGAFGVFTDIAALKQAEESLRASKNELESLVTARTEELKLANVRLHALTRDIVSSQEEERRRVARELHDEAGQALTSLKLSLEMMRAELPSGPTGHHQQIDEIVSLTDKTLEQIRILAQGLRPPALDSAGLDAALRGLCGEFAQRTQIQIDYSGIKMRGKGPAAICLYRFLQEALTNAARHGHATEIHVRLEQNGERASLLVEDNGHGFDPLTVLSGRGTLKSLGLVGMQERLEMVGGWLKINSKPEQGAQLIAYVPLEEI